ncbi:hypothetical protein FB107DRAFT_248753 [Schizophyllum commune]
MVFANVGSPLFAKQPYRNLLTFCDAFAFKQIWELCKVLALFIKSDLLCFICPAVLLALGLSGFSSVLSLFNGLLWVTLSITQFYCIAASATQQTLPLSIVYVIGTTAYNDGHLSRFWILKSMMNGIGIAMCSRGAVVCFHFRDRVRDFAIERGMLPIMLPSGVVRWTLGDLIIAWSTILLRFWLPPTGSIGWDTDELS